MTHKIIDLENEMFKIKYCDWSQDSEKIDCAIKMLRDAFEVLGYEACFIEHDRENRELLLGYAMLG
jgi:hypothetical protein